jgi:hypothetical protein
MQSRPVASNDVPNRSSVVPHSIPVKGGTPPQATAEIKLAASGSLM